MLCNQLDLAYPISVVSQHMANPNLKHEITIKHIFQYLQGTLQFKLQFRGIPPLKIVKYCDTDWVNYLEDRKSTMWFVFMIRSGTISRSSKQQPIIVLSTTKVEYIASTQTTKKTIQMTKFMKELRYMKEKKMMVI